MLVVRWKRGQKQPGDRPLFVHSERTIPAHHAHSLACAVSNALRGIGLLELNSNRQDEIFQLQKLIYFA